MIFPPTPEERDPRYFRTWQRVSVELQKSFRRWASEIYFRDLTRCQHRDPAFLMVVFSAARPFYGRPRAEFTYDLAEPEQALASAWHTIGTAIRSTLAPLEQRLLEAGLPELAHRFAPVWYQDVLVAVKKRSRREFIRLLAQEARLIDGLIIFGTRRNPAAEACFAALATATLRNFHGVDMTELIPRILASAADVAGRANHLGQGGIPQRGHALPSRRPDGGIGTDENGHNRRADGGGQMADSRIVADINPRRREPAGEFV